MSRLHAERDKAVSDVEKVREELERCQSTLGKLQLQQEKTQQGYDKAQNEVDRLQERLDKTLAESRKVNRSALSSFYRFLSDNFSFSYCCCCCLLGWWRPIDLVPFYASLIDDIDRTFSSRARRRSTSTTLTTCRPSWINRPASCRASKRRRRTSNKKWSAFGTSTTKTRQERNNPPGLLEINHCGFSFLFCFNQSVTLRLQKERDAVAQEVTSLREKLELVQSQVAKATRDRELLLSETESSRERFDKVNQSLVKVQVRPPSLFSH